MLHAYVDQYHKYFCHEWHTAAAAQTASTLQLVLQYVNAEEDIDTIVEHQAVDKASGSVW